jgi:hypothetical protein
MPGLIRDLGEIHLKGSGYGGIKMVKKLYTS